MKIEPDNIVQIEKYSQTYFSAESRVNLPFLILIIRWLNQLKHHPEDIIKHAKDKLNVITINIKKCTVVSIFTCYANLQIQLDQSQFPAGPK